MSSNTDDGIVVVARAICRHWPHSDPSDCASFETPCTAENCAPYVAAQAALAAYESHLRDKGMVVVPRVLPVEFQETLSGHFDNDVTCGTPYKAVWFWAEAIQLLSASPVQSERET